MINDFQTIANTPKPPYYAVMFSSLRTENQKGYKEMSNYIFELALKQEGCLGVETARDSLGITVSFWRDEASILKWKEHADHIVAKEKGKKDWYTQYKVRICKVERDYEWHKLNHQE